MRPILAGISSLVQHISTQINNPLRYKPNGCPHCGHNTLWGHGFYSRKSDRESTEKATLNPILISHSFCPNCNRTCSRLPECLPPYRWYLWLIQEAVMLLFFSGLSFRKIAAKLSPSRWTVRRWLHRFKELFSTQVLTEVQK